MIGQHHRQVKNIAYLILTNCFITCNKEKTYQGCI